MKGARKEPIAYMLKLCSAARNEPQPGWNRKHKQVGIAVPLLGIVHQGTCAGVNPETQCRSQKRDGNPYRLVLSIPTMRWLIPSGAAQFQHVRHRRFLALFVIRVHEVDVANAG